MSKAIAKKDPRELNLPGCTLKAVGAVFDKGMTFDQWVAAGHALERMEGSVQWWIGDWLNYGEQRPQWGDKYEQAISLFDRDYDILAHYKAVSQKIEFRLRNPNLSWSHHRAVAYEEPKVREELLAAAAPDPDAPDKGPRLTVAEIRSELRQRKRASVMEQMKDDAGALTGKYAIIYADPPWQYDFAASENRAIENHYPTMPVDDICALKVGDIALDDSLLLLWATNPKLPEAIRVIESWGFTYKTNATWVKHAIGMGYYFRQRHELLLVATRGNFPTPPPEARPDSVMEFDRQEHSKKPLDVYGIIDAMYPEFVDAKYRIELFQRKPADNWTGWGNQA